MAENEETQVSDTGEGTATETRSPFITEANVTRYTSNLKTYIANKITNSIGDIGTIFTLHATTNRVDTVEDLPAEAEVGNVVLVGLEGAASFDEYYYTPSNKWELMGTTQLSLEGVTMNEALYAGADGTGTAIAPAEGTILKSIYDEIDALQTEIDAINNETTGILALAKAYADNLAKALDTRVSNLDPITDNVSSDEFSDSLFAE